MPNHQGESFQGPIQKDHDRQRHVAGKEPAGFLICSKCQAVHHDKRWQWNAPLAQAHKTDQAAQAICPACKTKRPEEAEGILELEGFVSDGQKQEILNMLKNAGQRATERDPLDRIYHWEDQGKKVIVYLTENQLTMSLGRQVHKAFNGRLDFHTSKDADVVRVKWQGWTG